MAEDDSPSPSSPELPGATVEEAERLTRLARGAADESERAAYRAERDALLAERGFAARVREEDEGAVLVCYPAEWIEDGIVRPGRIEDRSRAVERRLSGPGEAEDWEHIAAHNEGVAERVAAEYGEVHGANARAFAEFMSNHHARRVESASEATIAEFLTEFFPRNAWPTDEQEEVVEESLALVEERAGGRSGE